MSVIAGLTDFRQQAPPADIGVFQFPGDRLVFKFNFSGIAYVCAIRSGQRGWVLVDFDVSSAANDTTVIQSALTSLTAGRGWKETVVVQGDYTINATLLLYDYTLLDLTSARITLADNSDCDMIANQDQDAGNTTIEIRGGILDGNSANNAGTIVGIRLDHIEYSMVFDCMVYDCNLDGIRFEYAEYCNIQGCQSSGNGQHGIMVHDHSYYNTIEDNICYDNGNHGISLERYVEYNNIEGNLVMGNVKGLVLEVPPNYYNLVCDNSVCLNSIGIMVIGTSVGTPTRFNNFVGNNISDNENYGFRLTRFCLHNNVVANVLVGNGTDTNNTWDDIWVDDNCSYNNIEGNLCRAGIEANKSRYGINISDADCIGNRVVDNDLHDDGFGTRPFRDNGTDTELNTIHIDFVKEGGGSAGWTIGPPSGIDIDADGELALCHCHLPLSVNQVVRISFWAYSNVVEAANNMLLELLVNAGASGEAHNTHVINVASHPSEETGGIAIGDVIHWVIDRGDDADFDDLAGCDYLELLAIGEAVADPDIATDALFGGVVIEYV